MPTWLNYALWFLWVWFTAYQILTFLILFTNSRAKLNSQGRNIFFVYIIITTLWLSYNIFG